MDKKILRLLVLFLVAAMLFGCSNVNRKIDMPETIISPAAEKTAYKEEVKNTSNVKTVEKPAQKLFAKEKMKVKGIYVTGNTAGDKIRFNRLVKLINNTELNAIVLDVKDDDGSMTYRSSLESVKKTGANSNVRIKDMNALLQNLNKNNIYPIARIVTFKDNKAASKYPNLAIKNTDGGVWRDRNGVAWLNPYNRGSWDYVVDIAEEAVQLGFREIQFDYVRFPTDGALNNISYGAPGANMSKEDAIAGFLKYAKKRLNNTGVELSADVFGLVNTVKDDMGIGQNLEKIASSVDIVSPMVYPSHYYSGSFGIKDPDFEPYKVVYKSVSQGVDRIETLPKGKRARMRPWLQSFTANYMERYRKYDADEIRAQIKAANDAGAEEWLLWSAVNKYDAGALKRR